MSVQEIYKKSFIKKVKHDLKYFDKFRKEYEGSIEEDEVGAIPFEYDVFEFLDTTPLWRTFLKRYSDGYQINDFKRATNEGYTIDRWIASSIKHVCSDRELDTEIEDAGLDIYNIFEDEEDAMTFLLNHRNQITWLLGFAGKYIGYWSSSYESSLREDFMSSIDDPMLAAAILLTDVIHNSPAGYSHYHDCPPTQLCHQVIEELIRENDKRPILKLTGKRTDRTVEYTTPIKYIKMKEALK